MSKFGKDYLLLSRVARIIKMIMVTDVSLPFVPLDNRLVEIQSMGAPNWEVCYETLKFEYLNINLWCRSNWKNM